MKKMLFICPRPIFPVVWGEKIRYYNNLKLLLERFEVDVICLTNNEYCIKESDYKCLKVNNFYCFSLSKFCSIFNVIIGLLINKLPLQVNYFHSRKMNRWIKNNAKKYDLIFCNNIRTAQYVQNLDVYKILDYVDSISMNYSKALHNSTGIWKLMYIIEMKRVFDFEIQMLCKFDKKIIISDIDRDYIRRNNDSEINVVGNFVEDFSNNIVDVTYVPYRIGFLGKMNYEPNVTAVKYFVREIFPKIKILYPMVEFYIMGGYPSSDILSLADKKSIFVTGFIDNIHKEMKKCHVIVAPMRTGAGLQNKIIQAMSLSRCVITTPVGIEGLPNLKGDEILIANSTTEYIDLTCMALSDNKIRINIENNAYDYVQKNFSFSKISQQLNSVFDF